MLHYGAVLHILGWLMGGFGAAMLVPAGVSLYYGEHHAMAFVTSAIMSFFVGGNLMFMNKGKVKSLSHKDGFLLTALTWTVLGLLGAMPMYISDVTPSLVDAVFESFSGLTTTGATVIVGLDDLSKGILFWRALLQWLGGMGVVVLAIAILPFLGIGGMQLYKTEMPGVVKDKLQPRLQETAKLLWVVYLLLTTTCAVAYHIMGMSIFDAICHSFTTVAIGGFANYDQSFGHFANPNLEWVAIIFMFIGGTNYVLHYTALNKRSLKMYWENTEFRYYTFYVAAATLFAGISYVIVHHGTEGFSLKAVLFNIVSIVTTTGYATHDYSEWPVFVPMLLLILMFFGGCSGSTSGGLKVLRVMLIAKQGQRELRRLRHPRSIQHVKVQGHTVGDDVLETVWSFVGLFFFTFAVLSLALTFMGIDLITAISAAAATITNTGPGLGEVGPAGNYAGLPAAAKVLLCFSMVVGRLEIFTILVIFTPQFWRR